MFRLGGLSVNTSSRFRAVLLVAGVVLLAMNLRPTITGVGPLVSLISRDTGLSTGWAGSLTTLPLLAFGLVSPVAPGLVRRLGLERSLLLGLMILTVGTIIRSLGPVSTLLIGMFLVGGGVAIGNVLIPSLVKRDFPHHLGIMTGMYSTVMGVFAAVASGISIPLAMDTPLGWQGSLGIWSLLSLIGLLVWLPHVRRRQQVPTYGHLSLWRSPLAWQVTLFMGLQSFLFYCNVAWLPTLLHSLGMPLATAGWMISLMQLISLPGSFLMPIWAGRRPDQRPLMAITGVLFLIGYIGLLTLGIRLAWLWIACIGFAGGASISLALTYFSLRTKSARDATQLSGMAQSVGYLIAAIGPISLGMLYDATHAWVIPLVVLLAISLLMLVAGIPASRNMTVEVPGESA